MEQIEQTNTDQLVHAELDAIAGAAAANEPQQPQGPVAPPMDWRMAAAGVVLIFDSVIAPNWQLESGEKDALASGFEQVLSAFFPTTNIDPRVQALMALGGVMLAITAKRTNFATREVVPMRIKPPEPQESEPHAAAA